MKLSNGTPRACRLLCLVVIFSCAGKTTGMANTVGRTPIDRAVAGLASGVAEQAKKHHINRLDVPPFQGPANTGRSYSKKLVDALKRESIDVSRMSPNRCLGRFRVDTNERGVKVLVLSAELIDRMGRTIGTRVEQRVSYAPNDRLETVIDYTGIEAISVALGVTGAFEKEPVIRQYAKLDRMLQQEPFVDVTRVQASEDSDYSIEILASNQPLQARSGEGAAFVQMTAGTEYSVRLFNDSSLDAAVSLHIDGLGVFEFDANASSQTYLIVPRHGTLTMMGWYMGEGKASRRFKATNYPDSAIGQMLEGGSTGGQQEIGQITAVFRAAWQRDQEPPTDEPPLRGVNDRIATGFGRPVQQKLRQVERVLGRTRAAVTLRYGER